MMRLSRRPKEPELIQLSRSVYYKQVVSNDGGRGGDGDAVRCSLTMTVVMMMMTVVMMIDDGSDDHGGHGSNVHVNNNCNC